MQDGVTGAIKVKDWVLDALTMQAQLPVLNRPIKETSNNRKHREEVCSVGSYWEEEQIKTSHDTSLKSILGPDLTSNLKHGVSYA